MVSNIITQYYSETRLLENFLRLQVDFVTDKNSIYLYTGVQAEYELGPLNIVPSFAPGIL